MFYFWLALRTMKTGKNFSLTAVLSIIGLALGVACMVVSMVVLTSYLGTLKKTVIDIYGDINLVKNISVSSDKSFMDSISPDLQKSIVAHTPFLNSSAIVVQKGKMSAVFVQGFDSKTVNKVLNLGSRLVEGEKPFSAESIDQEHSSIWIGRRLAEQFGFKQGDTLNLVVPIDSSIDNFKPKLKKFIVKGVMSFGRYDYDLRYLITDVESLKSFAELSDKNYGYRIKIKDSDLASDFALKLNQDELSGDYWASSWRSINANLFAAADYEKIIIFFVLLIIIIVACFNVSSTLFVNVLGQFRDIAVLKSMGVTAKNIKKIFIYQGLIIGFMGYISGVILGGLCCYMFIYAQENLNVLNSQVYKLEQLVITFDVVDILAVGFASMFICFLATLIPAIKGGKLTPMKGFRYE